MNNSNVAHAWANQTCQSAKGSNFYFDGPTIYSYGGHFPLAHICPNGDILINKKHYSMSTARHKRHVYKALGWGQDGRVIEVAYPDRYATGQNIEHFTREINDYRADILRGRFGLKAQKLRIGALESLIANAEKYINCLAQISPATLEEENAKELTVLVVGAKIELSEFIDEQNAVVDKPVDPDTAAKREKSRQQRAAAKLRKDATAWELWASAPQRGEWVSIPKTWKEKEQADGATPWRINGANVETARGIKFPLSCLPKFLGQYENKAPEIFGFKVDYTLSNETTAVIGCHLFNIENMKNIVK